MSFTTLHALALGATAMFAFAPATAWADATQGSADESSNQASYLTAEAAEIEEVDPEVVYSGWSARELMDRDVSGSTGDQLGEIQNIMIGSDGKATAIIVEGGGFADFADATFRVPFEEIELGQGDESVTATQLTEQSADEYGLFDRPEAVHEREREFRVTELIGDYARLESGEGFGYVRDVVFDDSGKIAAVIVNRDVTYGAGLYAYPYYGYGYGWAPGYNVYALPADSLELAAESPAFDYDRFDS